MKIEKYVFTEHHSQDKLYEMSNLFPYATGLNYVVWISAKSNKERHWARIKIADNDGEASISIDDNPEVKSKKGNIKISGKNLKDIKQFIALNKDVLLDHWNGKIDSKQLGERIKSI